MALKILVVDDASFTRDLIRRTLRKHFPSAQLEEAVNGRKAQQQMKKIKFDMILCDWEMPEMTGLELLEWCRQQEHYKKEDVPFVMITSRGDKDHVVEAVKTGVTDYLGKPFSSEQLVNKIVSAAKKHNMAESLMDKGARGSGAEKEALDNLTNSAGGPKGMTSHTSGSLDVLLGGKAPKAGGASKGMASHTSGSLDVLLGGKSVKAATVNKPKITHPKVTVKDVKIPSMVRFAGKQFRTMVIQFSCTEASLLIKSDDVIPCVLDQAVLDLEFKDKVNRLNYFVQGVATTEKKPSSPFLTVTLGLIDQDEEKESFIKALFESL